MAERQRDLIKRLFDAALALHQAGDLKSAQENYESVLRLEDRHADAWHLLGVIHHQSGDSRRAIELIGQAIALDSRQPIYFNNLGASYLALAQPQNALEAFRHAVQLQPDYIDALCNLGNTCLKCGDQTEAKNVLQKALQHDSRRVSALQGLVKIHVQNGERQEAIELQQRIVALAPQPQNYIELANLLMSEMKPIEAVAAYEEALARGATSPPLRMNLGRAYAEYGQLEKAREQFGLACQVDRDKTTWRLAETVLCPIVFESAAQIDEYRDRLFSKIDALAADPPQVDIQEVVNVGFYPPFPLSFQGREHRPLKEKFAELFRNWIKPLDVDPGEGKRRIGFVVTQGHEGVFVRCMAEIVQGLDPDLQPVVLCSETSVAYIRSQLHHESLEFVTFASTVESAVREIATARCHVLYFWEVGSDALNYVLPFYRLAPVQVTSWGTQVTSGLQEVDYYLSSSLIEQEHAQQYYTERLHRFEALPTYQRRHPVPLAVPRSYFGFPEDRTIYLCPQTILKLHPEQDVSFAEILARDPQGILVLKEGRYPQLTDQLKTRLRRSFGDHFERVFFVSRQSHEDYLRLLDQADVILDTHYFSAGTTAYDFFSFGLPVVTWPGKWNIGRFTLACYRQMDVLDLITDSQEQFIERAVQVGTDRNFRIHLQQRLMSRCDRLFKDRSTIREHSQFFSRFAYDSRETGRIF